MNETVSTSPSALVGYPPRPPEPECRPTWAELVAAEPRLLALEDRAIELHTSGPDDWRAWDAIKRAMSELVGWQAAEYSLRPSAAYEVAYRHLLTCWELGRR